MDPAGLKARSDSTLSRRAVEPERAFFICRTAVEADSAQALRRMKKSAEGLSTGALAGPLAREILWRPERNSFLQAARWERLRWLPWRSRAMRGRALAGANRGWPPARNAFPKPPDLSVRDRRQIILPNLGYDSTFVVHTGR